MMTITPINPAEAIIAPLFDQDISNYCEFRVVQSGCPDQELKQSWDSCILDTKALQTQIIWEGNLLLDEYDSLRLFITFSPSVLLSGFAVVDGVEVTLFQNITGENAPLEPTSSPLKQGNETAVITKLRFVFDNAEQRDIHIRLGWVGLLASTKEHLIEEAIPKYTSEWAGLLNPDGQPSIDAPIYYTTSECEDLKRRFQTEPFRHARQALERSAAKWENFAPEAEIRHYIPCGEHLYRYVRVRDRERTTLEEPIVDLAIAGYLCDRPDWSHLAARMMLSAAHTPCWYEGPQCDMPGSTWHHVCFMEDHYSSAMATALQFIGNFLTEDGVERVLDSIERAWQVVNAKCEESGYRWYMNQGLVGNRGRLIGALCLYQHGRGAKYRDYVEQAYQDHCTIMQNYLNEEGHCFEGPLYYAQYSLTTSIQLWTAYATYRRQSVSEIVPSCVHLSTQYVEAMMSSTSELGYVCPINNCGPGKRAKLPTLTLAFLATECNWKRAFAYLDRRQESSGEKEGHGESGLALLFLLRYLPETHGALAPIYGGLGGCLKSGLLTYEFRSPEQGKFWFLCERSALVGHHHLDRGSIVLEAYGQILLLDPGVTHYSNPITTSMAQSSWHNMAYVDGISMTVKTDPACSAHLQTFEEFSDGVSFSGDMSSVYDDRVRESTRSGRLTVRDGAGEIDVRDTWEFTDPQRLNLCFQSYSPWTISGNLARTQRGDIDLTLQTVSEDGHPLDFRTDDSRIDGVLTPIYALIIESPSSLRTTLASKITYSKT